MSNKVAAFDSVPDASNYWSGNRLTKALILSCWGQGAAASSYCLLAIFAAPLTINLVITGEVTANAESQAFLSDCYLAATACTMLLGPPLCAFSDYFGRRILTVGSLWGYFFCAVSFYCAAKYDIRGLFFVGYMLIGTTSPYWAGALAYISDITPPAEMNRSLGKLFLSLWVALITGIMVSIPVFSSAGWKGSFICGMVNAGSAAIVLTIAQEESVTTKIRKPITLRRLIPINESYLLFRNPFIALLTFSFVLTQVAQGAWGACAVNFTVRRFMMHSCIPNCLGTASNIIEHPDNIKLQASHGCTLVAGTFDNEQVPYLGNGGCQWDTLDDAKKGCSAWDGCDAFVAENGKFFARKWDNTTSLLENEVFVPGNLESFLWNSTTEEYFQTPGSLNCKMVKCAKGLTVNQALYWLGFVFLALGVLNGCLGPICKKFGTIPTLHFTLMIGAVSFACFIYAPKDDPWPMLVVSVLLGIPSGPSGTIMINMIMGQADAPEKGAMAGQIRAFSSLGKFIGAQLFGKYWFVNQLKRDPLLMGDQPGVSLIQAGYGIGVLILAWLPLLAMEFFKKHDKKGYEEDSDEADPGSPSSKSPHVVVVKRRSRQSSMVVTHFQ